MTDLSALEAARERAWLEYNAIAQDLPDCDHVTAWRQETAAARRRHLDALRELERAMADQGAADAEARTEPVPPSLPDDVGCQAPLPGLEAA